MTKTKHKKVSAGLKRIKRKDSTKGWQQTQPYLIVASIGAEAKILLISIML